MLRLASSHRLGVVLGIHTDLRSKPSPILDASLGAQRHLLGLDARILPKTSISALRTRVRPYPAPVRIEATRPFA